MPRYGRVPKRKIRPDAVYGSVLVQRFINKMTRRGKRSIAEKVFYLVMDEVKKRTSKEPVEIFTKALDNVSPLLEVKARRVGGATYQVPVEVTKERGQAMAMQWIITNSRSKPGRTMGESLDGLS